MPFQIKDPENLEQRISEASTEDLEEAVLIHDGVAGVYQRQLNLVKNALRKRQGQVEFRLSRETRVLAYAALFLTLVQTAMQVYELFR